MLRPVEPGPSRGGQLVRRPAPTRVPLDGLAEAGPSRRPACRSPCRSSSDGCRRARPRRRWFASLARQTAGWCGSVVSREATRNSDTIPVRRLTSLSTASSTGTVGVPLGGADPGRDGRGRFFVPQAGHPGSTRTGCDASRRARRRTRARGRRAAAGSAGSGSESASSARIDDEVHRQARQDRALGQRRAPPAVQVLLVCHRRLEICFGREAPHPVTHQARAA